MPDPIPGSRSSALPSRPPSLASLTAGGALAGEVKGPPGKGGLTRSALRRYRSACALDLFVLRSGRRRGCARPTAAHVQNWGQIPKVQRDAMSLIGFHPGDSCNGHSGFFSGAGGE